MYLWGIVRKLLDAGPYVVWFRLLHGAVCNVSVFPVSRRGGMIATLHR